jgi:tight adherence protein B
LNDLWIIYVVIFCAVLLAVQGAYWIYIEEKVAREAVNRRLVLSAQNINAREVLETLKRERGLIGVDNRYTSRFNRLLIQTGLQLNGKTLVFLAFSLGVTFFIALGFGLGYGLLSMILAVLFAAGSMVLFLVMARRRRIAKFSEQLPNAIDVIVRGVKAGYPFNVALSLVAREMSDPIGTEFGMTSDEINFGSDVSMALDNLYRRVGHDDLPYLIMAIKIQSETGGNLGEILARLSRLLRERMMLRLKVRSITGEGRLSARYLTAMPFVLFGVVTLLKRDYYTGVANNPIIVPAVVIALLMLVVGNIVIYRMVNFKV